VSSDVEGMSFSSGAVLGRRRRQVDATDLQDHRARRPDCRVDRRRQAVRFLAGPSDTGRDEARRPGRQPRGRGGREPVAGARRRQGRPDVEPQQALVAPTAQEAALERRGRRQAAAGRLVKVDGARTQSRFAEPTQVAVHLRQVVEVSRHLQRAVKRNSLRLAFHDADTDIPARIFADMSDTRDFLSYSCGKLNDTPTFARMSARMSVSASWNASFTVLTRDFTFSLLYRDLEVFGLMSITLMKTLLLTK